MFQMYLTVQADFRQLEEMKPYETLLLPLNEEYTTRPLHLHFSALKYFGDVFRGPGSLWECPPLGASIRSSQDRIHVRSLKAIRRDGKVYI